MAGDRARRCRIGAVAVKNFRWVGGQSRQTRPGAMEARGGADRRWNPPLPDYVATLRKIGYDGVYFAA